MMIEYLAVVREVCAVMVGVNLFWGGGQGSRVLHGSTVHPDLGGLGSNL